MPVSLLLFVEEALRYPKGHENGAVVLRSAAVKNPAYAECLSQSFERKVVPDVFSIIRRYAVSQYDLVGCAFAEPLAPLEGQPGFHFQKAVFYSRYQGKSLPVYGKRSEE